MPAFSWDSSSGALPRRRRLVAAVAQEMRLNRRTCGMQMAPVAMTDGWPPRLLEHAVRFTQSREAEYPEAQLFGNNAKLQAERSAGAVSPRIPE